MTKITNPVKAGLRILLWCYFLLIASPSFAQPGVLAGNTQQYAADTTAIISSLDLARKIMYAFPDSTAAITKRGLEQSRKLGFSYGIGRFLLQQGTNLSIGGAYDKAIPLYVEAIPYLNQTEKGKRELPRVYSNLGNISYWQGTYQTALQYYYKGLEIATTSYPDMNVDYICTNLAGVLVQIGRDTESVDYYLHWAEQMAFRHRNYDMLGTLYINKGLVQITVKSWDKSFYYFRKALAFGKAAQQLEIEHLALSNLGITWLKKGQGDSALYYLLLAQKTIAAAPAAVREVTNGALGMAYLLTNQADKARPLIVEQYRAARASGNSVNIRIANDNMSQLYAALKNYAEAYRYSRDYITLNDTLSGKEVSNNVNQLEVDYRTSEKEKMIFSHELEIARQDKELETKNKWIVIAVCILSALLMLFFLLRSRYKSHQQLLENQVQAMEQSAEIEMLKATIQGEEKERMRIARDLHDGLGALTSAARINLEVLSKQAAPPEDMLRKTAQLLDEISTDLRFTAHNMMPRALMEKNLPEAVIGFCEHIRNNKGLDIQVETFGHFETLPEIYMLSTYRIVQELLHNAEKHAHASQVLVQLSYRDNLLVITVEDDGTGFDASTVAAKAGIGLESLRGRVKSLRGLMTLNSSERGTSVYVEFLTINT